MVSSHVNVERICSFVSVFENVGDSNTAGVVKVRP
jgi:hypothetical protein